jgi:hypothetical protein
MNTQTVGTCSICGGAVTLPTMYWSVVPPVPTCSRCGAMARSSGPVIPMAPAPRRSTVTVSGCSTIVWPDITVTPTGWLDE